MRRPHLHNLAHVANKPLSLFLTMTLFGALFDGIASYLIPVLIVNTGVSNTFMGVVLGSSSVVGALFDFILSKYLVHPHYRRVYFLMFAINFLFLFILFHASTIWFYLIVMALWGFYYDLIGFGNLDYVSRNSEKSQYSSNLGMLQSFRSMGYLIAPIIIGFVVGEVVDAKPFVLMLIFLLISFSSFLMLLYLNKHEKKISMIENEIEELRSTSELKVWATLIKILFPVLIFNCILLLSDAFFWTVGPLLAESLDNIHPFNGLIMAAYSLPPLYMGFFVGRLALKYGKKRLAYTSFIFGSLVLSLIMFTNAPFIIMGLILVASTLISLALPAIGGAYVDYIDEARTYEREIEGLQDFSCNLGYIIGPVLAGFLADSLGYNKTFGLLGIFSSIIVLILIKFTPKSIKIKVL